MTNMNSVDNGIWILGYGSLIYKPPPHYRYRLPVTINGFVRRFWQSSIDHRGTPVQPGRVATLINYDEIILNEHLLKDFEEYNNHDNLSTLAVVYYIPENHIAEVTEYLDIREQNGYRRYNLNVELEISKDYIIDTHLNDPDTREHLLALYSSLPDNELGDKKLIPTSVYIGALDNEAFVGPELVNDTAKVIAHSIGPSGPNYEYLKLLYDSLIELQKEFGLAGSSSSNSSSESNSSECINDDIDTDDVGDTLAEKLIDELVIENYLHCLLGKVESFRIV